MACCNSWGCLTQKVPLCPVTGGDFPLTTWWGGSWPPFLSLLSVFSFHGQSLLPSGGQTLPCTC